ncbi:MAG: PilW family protein [Methylotenera sp.]|jgi:type IV pilus assembly protein PilW
MRFVNQELNQKGFSLIELMVGLVIGLIATLVIMQVFSAYEGQKRSTSGTADAQTNGTIALMNLQSNIQMAGYGLPMPMASIDNSSLACSSFADFDPDNDVATNNSTNLFPIEIQDGGGAASDVITVRYSTTAAGAVPVTITDPTGATSSPGLNVANNIGCGGERSATDYANMYAGKFNMALVMRGSVCGLATIDEQPSVLAGVSKIKLKAIPASLGALAVNDKIACMGDWQDYTFDVNNNALQLNGQPIVSEVVQLQAQYGISATPDSNVVTSWVDAAGATWGAPTVTNRNRIKAVRLAVVLRNGLKEKTEVTPTAPIAWADSGTTQITMDVSSLSDWKYYRYRVFSTTVPLRNILWSREAV